MARKKSADFEVRKLEEMITKEMRARDWEELTEKQKAFFSRPEFVRDAGQFLIRNQGSKAWLCPKGEAIQLGMMQTEVANRRQGLADQLLTKICAMADEFGVALTLRAQPSAETIGAKQKDLIAWYKSHGFNGVWDKMTRSPRKPKP